MPTSSPVVGGTYQFEFPITIDGDPWNITGATLAITFTRSDQSTFSVTGSVIPASAKYVALGFVTMASYVTIGQNGTVPGDLNLPGSWSVNCVATLAGIQAPSGELPFNVRQR